MPEGGSGRGPRDAALRAPAQGGAEPPFAPKAGKAPASSAPDAVAGFVAGPFRDVLPRRGTAIGRYTLHDQFVDLVRIPQRPRRVFNLRHLFALAKRTTDFFGHRRGWFGAFLMRANPYPRPFRRVEIPSFDGTVISGWLGLQPGRRPGILLVPGMFSSKDDTVHKSKAIRIWRRWNYNVLIIDLRGFGQSGDAPNTPGWKEAEDVLAAARFLHAFNNVSSVGVLAESLGATASLLAAAQEGMWEVDGLARLEGRAVPISPPKEGEDPAWALPGARPQDPVAPGALPRRVIAGVLAFSCFADARRAVEHINRMPSRRDPFFRVQRLFIRLLSLRTRGAHADFQGYMEASAKHYGVDLDTLYERSDLRRAVGHIRAPALIIHAEDDPTVPAAQARHLEDLVRGHPAQQVWVVPWGRHVEFDLLDNGWYWQVLARFFAQWVGR